MAAGFWGSEDTDTNGFDWDEGNISHIAKHAVLPHEAEEAYDSNPLYLDYSFEDGKNATARSAKHSRVASWLSSARCEASLFEW